MPVIAASGLFSTAAYAQCDLTLEPVNVPGFVTYDGLSIGPTRMEQDYRATNEGSDVCEFRLALQAGGTDVGKAVKGGDILRLEWLDGDNRPVAANQPSGVGRILTLAPANSAGLTIRLSIPSGQLVSAGQYRNSVNLQLIEADSASRSILANSLLDTDINVAPVVGVALSGASAGGNVANVDFGTLETGETRRVVFSALSNSSYQLSFTAENRGALAHESLNARIPYAFLLNGDELDLSALTVRSFSEPSALRTPYNIVIRIGPVEGRPAGRYRDVVRMTIRPWR
jgi:hypothetical protein